MLEEAENERMHLLTFLKLKQPGPLFRFGVAVSQGVMFNAFFLAYIISPKTCHRFVGYIEEEAVHTYTSVGNHSNWLQYLSLVLASRVMCAQPSWLNSPTPLKLFVDLSAKHGRSSIVNQATRHKYNKLATLARLAAIVVSSFSRTLIITSCRCSRTCRRLP